MENIEEQVLREQESQMQENVEEIGSGTSTTEETSQGDGTKISAKDKENETETAVLTQLQKLAEVVFQMKSKMEETKKEIQQNLEINTRNVQQSIGETIEQRMESNIRTVQRNIGETIEQKMETIEQRMENNRREIQQNIEATRIEIQQNIWKTIAQKKSENATENVIENKHHYSSHRNNNFIHKHSNKKNKHITPLRETTTEDFRTFVIGDNEATSENPFFQPDDVGDVENETNNDDSITEPIVFTTEPVLTGKEGEDLKVSCGVSSSHQFTIFWSRQRGDIEEPKYERKVNDIIIRNLSREDNNDVFTCRVIDSVGEAPERNITIIVEHKPYLVYMSDTELYYPADEMVNLTCGVEANPAPVFRWTDNDGRRVRPINVSSHVSVIEVRMTEDAEGTYKCVAKNDHGKEERLFNLHLGYLPDPPLDIQLVGNTSNSISLNITLPDYVEDEEIMLPNFLIVQYRPKDKPDWEEQEYNISRVIFSVNNLEKATQYEFRAATRNLVGLSEFTNSTYFETSLAQSVQTNFLTLVSMIFVVMNLPVP